MKSHILAKMKPFACPECGKRSRTEEGVADHMRDAHGMQAPSVIPGSAATVQDVDPICIECGRTAQLVKGDRVYPHRADLWHKNFWLCRCGAYCGCHGVTTRPLGHPCGADTRKARMAAHAAFDPLWKSQQMGRREAYTWLSGAMGIPVELTHIGMMTAEQAREVVRLCRERRAVL